MAEEVIVDLSQGKESAYKTLIFQIKALMSGESNTIANVGNIIAGLKQSFNFYWVGLYLVDEKNEDLVLNIFQGPVACTRIKKGRGVCGTVWEKETLSIVSDVEKFPGHIACSSASKSEIVIPLFNNKGKVFGVLDIDSEFLNHFDEMDAKFLTIIAQIIEKQYV